MDSTVEECFGSDSRESQAQSQARPNKLCLEQTLGSQITIGHLALTDPIVSIWLHHLKHSSHSHFTAHLTILKSWRLKRKK